MLVGLEKGTAALGNNLAASQMIQQGTAVWPSNPTATCLSKRHENTCRHRDLYVNVRGSTIHSGQKVETTPVAING